MARLDHVKKWMTFFGWTNEGGPGAVLRIDGNLKAIHGSAKWERDVMAACIKDERDHGNEMLIDEIEASLKQEAALPPTE